MATEAKRPALLILNKMQFGYHLDSYYYCKLSADALEMSYIGFDIGRPKLSVEGVNVVYIDYRGNKVVRYLRLLLSYLRAIKGNEGVVFVDYFPGCSLFRLLWPGRRIGVDIRTGSVRKNRLSRRWSDLMMRCECRLFRNVSVVSQSLANRLRLPMGKTHILPLGAESLIMREKTFDQLHLLYVGTLDGRRIEETIVGVDLFLKEYGREITFTYTVVGDGHHDELDVLRRIARERGLEQTVRFTGYVHKTELRDVFEQCNIGVSYIPMTDVYDCQPPTKTFEYLAAGMPVIATATSENRRIVDRMSGVLIQDTPDGFCGGLKEICARRHEFHSETIRTRSGESSWDEIVGRNFRPYIESIC